MIGHITKRWVLWSSLLSAMLAVGAGYWPLSIAAIVLAALGGEWVAAICLGISFDLLYGRPPAGYLHTLSFPLTALALMLVVLRRALSASLRRRRTARL